MKEQIVPIVVPAHQWCPVIGLEAGEVVGYIETAGPRIFVEWVAMEIEDQQGRQFLAGTVIAVTAPVCVCMCVYIRMYRGSVCVCVSVCLRTLRVSTSLVLLIKLPPAYSSRRAGHSSTPPSEVSLLLLTSSSCRSWRQAWPRGESEVRRLWERKRRTRCFRGQTPNGGGEEGERGAGMRRGRGERG